MSKAFTALAIRQLEGEERLDNTEIVAKYKSYFTLQTATESIQRTYDRKVLFTPLLLLTITALSLYSCFRIPKRLLATKHWIVMLNLVIIHIALPATILIATQIIYDANWIYFLSSGIDLGLPMLVLSFVLIITGIIKAIRIFMYDKKHRKLLQ